MSVFSAPLGRIESVTQLFGYALGPDRAHRVQKHKRTQGPRDHGRSRPRNQRWIDFLRSTGVLRTIGVDVAHFIGALGRVVSKNTNELKIGAPGRFG